MRLFSPQIINMLYSGLLESLYMTFLTTSAAYLIGLPLGLILVVTGQDGIKPHSLIYNLLGTIINILRSVPFLILVIFLIPLTRAVVGTSLGPTATSFALTIAAFPLVARLVESSILEVDKGVIEAAESMGASPFQIVTKVFVPEALPSLINGSIVAMTTILSYSAMAGFIGGRGLGDIATRYGYYRYETDIMLVTVVLLVLLVQIIQVVGMRLMRRNDKRLP